MFCRDFKEQAIKIINTPQKTDNEKKAHENQYVCYLCKKEFTTDKKSKYYKNYKKV